LIAAGLVALTLAFAVPAGPCSANAQQEPLAVTLVESPATKSEAAQATRTAEMEAATNRYLFYVTSVLAVAAVLQWLVMLWQTLQIRKSVDLANKEFIAAHRPRLRLQRVSNINLWGGSSARAILEVANVGDSDARIVEVGVDLFPRSGNPGDFPYNAQPRQVDTIVIAAGKIAHVDVRGGRAISDNDLGRINDGTLQLCLLAAINYLDGSDIPRTVSAFRIYAPGKQRFLLAPDDDEFAEREFSF
jgi:hypothetical protein